MKALHMVVVSSFALLTSACAYPMYGSAPPFYHPRMAAAPAPPPSPVGRWDNVMILEPGTPVLVLQSDGTRTEGRFHSAASATLRIQAGDAVAQIAAADVVRVDRLSNLGGALRGEGLKGAAVGAGTVGVIGLIAGRTPPPRHWAAGAIIGGYAATQSQLAATGAATIYLVSADTARFGGAGPK